MKNLFVLILAFAFFSGCGNDDMPGPTTTVSLHFKALYGSDPLVMFQAYDYPGGNKIKFQQFNFFISNVTLLEAQTGKEVELVDVNFVDFSDKTTLQEAQTPVSFQVQNVPVGSYEGMRIGFGVPADMNKASANQLGAGHPLRVNYNSHFWSDWKSFIFLKSEGIYDYDNDGQFENDGIEPFAHHPGTNESYASVTLMQPIQLTENSPLDLDVLVNLLNLYVKNGQPLDMSNVANHYTHNPNDLTIAKYLMGNFQQAIVVE